MSQHTSASRNLRDPQQARGIRAQLLLGGVGSMIVQAGHALLALLLAVVLARALGADGYGVYSLALAVIMVIAIPAQAGLPPLVVRETAKAQAASDWGLMRGLWSWSGQFVAVFSGLLLIVSMIILWLRRLEMDETFVGALVIGLILIPLVALGNLRGAALRGLRHVVLGQLPEYIFKPAILIVGVIAWALLSSEVRLSPSGAMALHAFAAAVSFVFGAWLLKIRLPDGLRKNLVEKKLGVYWFGSAWPLAVVAGMQLINSYADIIVLGIFRSDAEVGVYRVATQGSILVAFGLHAFNKVVMPNFSRLYVGGETKKLQSLVTKSARAILAIAIIPVAVFFVWGQVILEKFFGDEFGVGYLALVILSFGQLINAAMGAVGMLLNMTGHEKDMLRCSVMAAMANIILNFALIPYFGMEGAAIATAITLVIFNISMRRAAKTRLDIEPFALVARKT